MAARADDESAREGDQRIVDLALEAVYKGQWQTKCCFHNGGRGGKDGGKNSWQKGNGKEGGTGQEKGGKGETRACWTCGTQDTLQLGVEKVATEFCMPLKRRTVSIVKKLSISKKICMHGVGWKRARLSSGRQ